MAKNAPATDPETTPKSRRLVAMPLSELLGAEHNPKDHATTEIGGAISKFGYLAPIILDERTQRLVAGHGRVEALRIAKGAGKTAPEGVDVREDGEWLVGVIRGWSSRSDEEAAAYLVADNRLSEKAGWDEGGLAVLLESVADAELLEFTGYSPDELDDMLAAIQESEAGGAELGDDDDDDPLGKQQRKTAGMAERAETYGGTTQRVLVLSYTGDRYVWVVERLNEILSATGAESNAEAVIHLLEEATGQTAPADLSAGDDDPDDDGLPGEEYDPADPFGSAGEPLFPDDAEPAPESAAEAVAAGDPPEAGG